MTGKIIINAERCKGCGLCVEVCPNGSIVISQESNKTGFFPAQVQVSDNGCTGCTLCALVCPDAVIEVLREKPGKDKEIDDSNKIEMVKEKK